MITREEVIKKKRMIRKKLEALYKLIELKAHNLFRIISR